MTAPLPRRKDEAWRYADFGALQALWPPQPPRQLAVAAGEVRHELLRVREGGIHDLKIELGAGARMHLVVLVMSAEYARVTVEATLAEGASMDLGGVLLGSGDTVQEILTDFRHLEPGATSRQAVRIVLDERATGSFMGRIGVAQAAQKTDAAQSARALVLKRTATANLKPELEIYADDVKCTHGATIGQLNADSIYYLRSRGLGPETARRMLIHAFAGEIIERIQQEPVRTELDGLVWERLEANPHLAEKQ